MTSFATNLAELNHLNIIYPCDTLTTTQENISCGSYATITNSRSTNITSHNQHSSIASLKTRAHLQRRIATLQSNHARTLQSPPIPTSAVWSSCVVRRERQLEPGGRSMGTNLIMLLAAAAAVTALAAPASGQAPTAVSCTASLVTSFTPCLSFITNSTNGSPTADCCQSLAALVNASTGCACLILTGNVPLGVPINRTLAVTLPRACNTMSVPLQCRDTSAQTPAPGPVAVAPSLPSSLPPATPGTPEPEAPAPPVSQGQTRPMVLPSSAWRAGSRVSATPAFVLLLAVGGALV
ncbi:non-specific lipid transfer protein GPI-anchored 20-like [Phragmites australis]|uniref:non-specific lipid transfer protein GPI-anchored 20-like n=1 Tax=Phragmites australis TaxID=29695 RepID=UPI002D770779|nr:non-specific lipid transfer protein GPI-anchored 20-like [Phragmites australis]